MIAAEIHVGRSGIVRVRKTTQPKRLSTASGTVFPVKQTQIVCYGALNLPRETTWEPRRGLFCYDGQERAPVLRFNYQNRWIRLNSSLQFVSPVW